MKEGSKNALKGSNEKCAESAKGADVDVQYPCQKDQVAKNKTNVKVIESTSLPFVLTPELIDQLNEVVQVREAWNFDGGTPSGNYTEANNALAYGSTITYPTMSKTGYTFAGWSTSATSMPDADLTITASWTPSTNTAYTVKHYKQNLDGTYPATPTETENLTGTTDAEVTPAVKNYTGFTAPEVQTVTILADGSRVVEYKYTRNSPNLSWSSNGGNALTGSYTTGSVKYGASITAPNDPTRTGYSFSGWSPAFTGTMPATDTEYNAQWTPEKRKVTWKDGTTTIKTEDLDYDSKPSYAYVKTPTAQYSFPLLKWEDEDTRVQYDPDNLPVVKNNVTYVAICDNVVNKYTIRFVNDNDEELESGVLPYGATPAYEGTPASSNKDERITRTFIGWTPNIVDVVGPATYTAQYQSDILATESATSLITISEPIANVVTTTVETTGKLEIESSGSLTTNTLILQATVSGATSGASGEITGADHIINDVNTEVYFDLTLNTWARHWHAFGVPWPIGSLFVTKLIEIKDKQGNDCHKELTLGRDYDIIYYNGATRASQGAGRQCWDYVEDGDGTLTPGKAYLIGFIKPIGTVRFQKAAGAAITSDEALNVPYYSGSNTKDEGWNAIANPKTYHTKMTAGVTWCFVHNGDTMKSDGFMTKQMADMEFVVGTAVFVQANPEQSVVTINPYASTSSAAPRREAVRENAPQYYEVDIKANGKFADCIYVKADEDKEADVYTNDIDVAKMGVSSVRAQMWIARYNAQLAVNTMAPVNNVAAYPLGIFVPQAGEYEISAKAVEDGDILYLTYDNRVIWNLNYAPYTVSFEKGTNEHYGLKLVRSNAPAVTTDMEQSAITDDQSQIMKVLIDDKVYILRGEEIYTITGQKAQ